MRGNGTAFVPTTATYPATAGTSGNVLTSDGTNFTSAATSAFTPVNWLVTLSAAQNNVTGNNTDYTIPYNTVVFDSNSAYNTGTYVYTVPVTGKYQIIINDNLKGGSAASTLFLSWLNVNGGGFGPNRIISVNPSDSLSVSGNYTRSSTVLISLNSGDTVSYIINCRNSGSNDIGVEGGSYTASFAGFRIA